MGPADIADAVVYMASPAGHDAFVEPSRQMGRQRLCEVLEQRAFS